jgi:hypothetical protein
MRAGVVALVVVAGCGRIAFDRHGDGGSTAGDDGRGDDDGASDSVTPALCGNGLCEGTGNELCATCMADCAVTTDVCGNGECSATEVTTCQADCGPDPWPFGADDAALLTEINNARTGGVTCPGDSMPRVAAAFTQTSSMERGVREYAWEIAHAQYFVAGGAACNGRTFGDRQAPYAANGGISFRSTGVVATPTQVVSSWKTSAMLCPALMNMFATQATTAVAHDTDHGYVVWWK